MAISDHFGEGWPSRLSWASLAPPGQHEKEAQACKIEFSSLIFMPRSGCHSVLIGATLWMDFLCGL